MGFLGALAGAGRGLQGYGQAMRQNQMMNWQAQQDQAKHERQVNLENLRAQNQRTAQEQQNTFMTERDATNRQYAQEDTRAAQDYAIETQGIQFDQNLKKQQMALETRLKTTSAAELKQAKDLFLLTEGLSATKRKDQVTAMKSSPQFAEMSPKEQESIVFAMEHPAAAQALAAMDKTKDFPVEQYNKAYTAALERWDAVPKEERQVIGQRAAAKGMTDPNDVRDFYASTVARKSTGLDRLIEQGLVEDTEPPISMPVPQAVQAAKSGKVTKEQVDAEVEAGVYTEQEGLTIKQAIPPTKLEPQRAGALQGTGDFTRPKGVPGRQLPEAMARIFGRTPIDNSGISEKQRQSADIY